MLKGVIKRRPRQLVAIYVEPRRVEILRAHRQWRSWQVEETESFTLSEGENVYDFLHRLNVKPAGGKGAALILFLPRCYYTFHREHYPSSIQDRLEEALSFDWEENLFHDHDRTIYFSGPPVALNSNISVPIFSLHSDAYDKFHQVLGGGAFQTFTVIPSALVYKALLPSVLTEETPLPMEIIGRIIDAEHLEIHRFFNGSLLDSMVIGKDPDSLMLFQENLRCLGNGSCQEQIHIHLLCVDNECAEAEQYGKEWKNTSLALQIHSLQKSLVANWVDYLLNQEQIQTFDTVLILKPWKVPRIVWPIAAAIVLYAGFGFYQVHSIRNIKESSQHMKRQALQMETQWKPVEQLQTRISKFQEDQKTLTKFSLEGYPLLEVLTLLSQTTPDDTWLNYFSLRKGQVVIRGESKSAIKYLSELSKVDGLNDVKFASPVTKNPVSDQERFNVQVQLDFDKLKKSFESMEFEKDLEKEEEKAEKKEIPAIATPAPVQPHAGEEATEEDASSEESPEESVEEAPEEANQEAGEETNADAAEGGE